MIGQVSGRFIYQFDDFDIAITLVGKAFFVYCL
jgi:hypothetical protein